MMKPSQPPSGSSPSWFAETLELLLARRDSCRADDAGHGRSGRRALRRGRAWCVFDRLAHEGGDAGRGCRGSAACCRAHGAARPGPGRRSRYERHRRRRRPYLQHQHGRGPGRGRHGPAGGEARQSRVSGRCGSADVLAALGVAIEGDAACARRCLDRAGIAFCFAPKFHPALANVAAVRRRLGVRTLFNCLGPLVNPAEAPYQLTGVGRPECSIFSPGRWRSWACVGRWWCAAGTGWMR